MSARILVAEDEPRITSFLQKGFRASGYSPHVVTTAEEAIAFAHDGDFEILILDLGLPDRDGMEVLRELRGRGEQLPIIILTARRDTSTTVAGLDGGANDFISKPFSFEELLARVRVALRETAPAATGALIMGNVVLDPRTRRASVDGTDVELSAREFSMLETFMSHSGQVLSREQLLSRVWGYDFDPGSNIVDVYVGYLRRKLGADSIETVRGMGYRMGS